MTAHATTAAQLEAHRRPTAKLKRGGAAAYGLCLTVGVLVILQPEIVQKFRVPLLYSRKAHLQYSIDGATTWKAARAVASNVLSVPLPQGYGEAVLLKARDPKAPLFGLEETAVGIEYSIDGGANWLNSEKTKANNIDYLAIPAGAFTGPVEARITLPSAKVTAAMLASLEDSLPAKMILAWILALVPIVPLGLFIAWVAMRLGYFKRTATIVTLVFFTIFGLTMIIPFLWMVSTAFKTLEGTDIFKVQWIPWPIRWENFYDVFSRAPFARFYINSVFLASYVTVGVVFTSSLAAYSFARLEFPGRDKIFMAYLATMMIPGAVTNIPVFVLMCKIGWVDSYKAIIIPGIFSAYWTFMLRQFFMTLPRDLEDAAKIDGCSLFGVFYRIILPLSKPAVATLTIFAFMGEWGDFMWPLIILNDTNKMPLPVGIQFFARAETPDPNVLMCASMLMIVPVIIVFLLGQRYFIEGIQLGAVKG